MSPVTDTRELASRDSDGVHVRLSGTRSRAP
jgi:hypothetical protein